MSTMEGVIIGLIVLSTLIVIRAIAELKYVIEEGLQSLDQNLAQAIQNTVTQIPIGDMEPINPIQQVLAQFLMSKVEQAGINSQPRDASGQFTVLESLES